MSRGGKEFSIAKYFVLACISVSLSFITSCKKDSVIGSNVLPAGDLLSGYITDTTSIISSLKLIDSIPTNYAAWYMLGSYNDPVFGMTKGSFYTQQILPVNFTSIAPGFGPHAILDSVVLALPFYNGGTTYYGSLGPQTVTVDTINAVNNVALLANKAYYSDTNLSHGTKHIGVATLIPVTTGTVTLYYPNYNNVLNYYPQLRIKLNKSFGQHIMNDSSLFYSSGANFPGYVLQGLYVSVSNATQLPGQGSILYIYPNGNIGAGLYFYYHYYDPLRIPAGNDTQSVQFPMGAGFSSFSHDYSTTSFYVPGKDSIVSSNQVYVQGMAGVKTQISFPYLSNWKNLKHVIINKAELDIPVNTNATASGLCIPPNQLALVRDSAGHQFTLIDQNMGTTYFGGTYNYATSNYVFNITRYIQSVLDGKVVDKGLYLLDGRTALEANGVVLYGGAKNTNTPRIQLKMYYTPLQN